MKNTKWMQLRPNLGGAAADRIQAERDEISLEINLRELLQHVSDLTQTDIAELLEISQAALSRLKPRQTQP